MRHSYVFHFLFATLLATGACGDPDGPSVAGPSNQTTGEQDSGNLTDAGISDVGAQTDPDAESDAASDTGGGVQLDFCDGVLATAHGSLCAIQPSKTDGQIKDFGGTMDVPGLGFGYHVVGFPNDMSNLRGIWIHFGGSYGRPYTPPSDKYATATFLDELLEQNFVVVQVAYDNKGSVNGDLCNKSVPGFDVDNCAGLVRREILEGSDYSDVIDVDKDNGVFNRLDKLIDHLNGHDIETPPYFQSGAIDWSKLRVSGHSQGSGHAYYLAKNIGVLSACFLAGPYDGPDSVNPGQVPVADWFTTPLKQTPVDNMGGFVVTTDDSYMAFSAAYNFMGLTKATDWFETGGDYTNADGEAIDGHAAAIGAPALKTWRAKACFTAAANF